MRSTRSSCGALSCEARHPGAKIHHHHRGVAKQISQGKKKRDISTSFRKGPVPRPLVTTTQQQPGAEEEPLVGLPPPAGLPMPAHLSAALSSTGLPLGNASWASGASRASTGEPVIAAAAVVAAPVLTPQDLLDLGLVSSSSSSSDSEGESTDEEGLWASDPLASFDRVLDGLLVAPVLPQAFTAPKPTATPSHASSTSDAGPSTPSSNLTLSSLLADLPVSTPAAVQKQQQPLAGSTSSSSTAAAAAGKASSSKKSSSRSWSLAAAAAAPAVTVIHCETEYEREVEAAAALQQLLVVKVESSQHLLQGALDSSLRFQTHTSLPTQLNAYLPHADVNQGFGYYGGSSSSVGGGSSSGGSPSGSGSTSELLASMGITLGIPSTPSSNPQGSLGQLLGSGSSSSGEPFSPVHSWYKQLAAQYAHSAAAGGRTSPVRFLSLQCDGARARAVARRLGVSSPLAVVLVDHVSGRKLQEVCGAKIEQELPNGLLYFGGSDPQGLQPTEQLAQLSTEAELEALKSSSQFAVAAFHIHAAPPCVRSYARMYGVAQQHSLHNAAAAPAAHPAVSFGVMDVDVAAEGGAVSSKLGLQHFPTYVIYQDGQEVARLSSSPDRRLLGEVLAQHMAAAAAPANQQ